MRLIHLLPIAAIASCTVGPDYKRPDMPSTKNWKEGKATAKANLPDEWWKLFHDSTLNRLVAKAQTSNQDLKGARARVQTARALIGVSRADWFPNLNSNSSFTEERLSAATFQQQTGGTSSSTTGSGSSASGQNKRGIASLTRHPFHSSLDLSYEVDLWGRVKRNVESARASMNAAEDALDANRLTIAAQVAQNYYLLRSLDMQAAVLVNTIKARQETLDLQETKFKAGLSNESDSTQAHTLLELARNDLIAVQRQRGSAEHALAVLCGEAPSSLSVAAVTERPEPPKVPVGLPSDLLQRRPDVRAAEENLVSINAQIGVAKAAFFPSFKLIGSGGFDSMTAADFLNWENRALSFAPSISIPIFNGGRNKANYEAAKSRYDESLATYRQTLIVAFREVEDALLDLKTYASQTQVLRSAVKSAQDTERLARTRNEKGLTSYFEVVDAERTVLTAQLTLAQVEGQNMLATVELLKAMGGGWQGRSSK